MRKILNIETLEFGENNFLANIYKYRLLKTDNNEPVNIEIEGLD